MRTLSFGLVILYCLTWWSIASPLVPTVTPNDTVFVGEMNLAISGPSQPGEEVFYSLKYPHTDTALFLQSPLGGTTIRITEKCTVKSFSRTLQLGIDHPPVFAKSTVIVRDYRRKAEKPRFSYPSGTYQHSLLLSISPEDIGATIHFTVDGTVPDTLSPIYTGEIFIATSTLVHAIAFASSMIPSDTVQADFIIEVE